MTSKLSFIVVSMSQCLKYISIIMQYKCVTYRVSEVKPAVLDHLDPLESQESLDHRVHLVSLAARDHVDLQENVENEENLEHPDPMDNQV